MSFKFFLCPIIKIDWKLGENKKPNFKLIQNCEHKLSKMIFFILVLPIPTKGHSALEHLHPLARGTPDHSSHTHWPIAHRYLSLTSTFNSTHSLAYRVHLTFCSHKQTIITYVCLFASRGLSLVKLLGHWNWCWLDSLNVAKDVSASNLHENFALLKFPEKFAK